MLQLGGCRATAKRSRCSPRTNCGSCGATNRNWASGSSASDCARGAWKRWARLRRGEVGERTRSASPRQPVTHAAARKPSFSRVPGTLCEATRRRATRSPLSGSVERTDARSGARGWPTPRRDRLRRVRRSQVVQGQCAPVLSSCSGATPSPDRGAYNAADHRTKQAIGAGANFGLATRCEVYNPRARDRADHEPSACPEQDAGAGSLTDLESSDVERGHGQDPTIHVPRSHRDRVVRDRNERACPALPLRHACGEPYARSRLGQ